MFSKNASENQFLMKDACMVYIVGMILYPVKQVQIREKCP